MAGLAGNSTWTLPSIDTQKSIDKKKQGGNTLMPGVEGQLPDKINRPNLFEP